MKTIILCVTLFLSVLQLSAADDYPICSFEDGVTGEHGVVNIRTNYASNFTIQPEVGINLDRRGINRSKKALIMSTSPSAARWSCLPRFDFSGAGLTKEMIGQRKYLKMMVWTDNDANNLRVYLNNSDWNSDSLVYKGKPTKGQWVDLIIDLTKKNGRQKVAFSEQGVQSVLLEPIENNSGGLGYSVTFMVDNIVLSDNATPRTIEMNPSEDDEAEYVDKVYKLWYDAPAPNGGGDYGIVKGTGGVPYDADWENWSLPLGNGYMGASVFGRTDTERIQISEKTLHNKGPYDFGGITNFAELYLDFNHTDIAEYTRELDLERAVSSVKYTSAEVEYTREYFVSYPHNVLAMKVKSDAPGNVSMVVRPEIPYIRPFGTNGNGRSGQVVAQDNRITLSGVTEYFDQSYEGQLAVVNYGGSLVSANDADNNHGTITVSGADSVVVFFTCGTNYVLSPGIFEKENKEKLTGNPHPHQAVTSRLDAAVALGYEALYKAHVEDYTNLFGRVEFQLTDQMPNVPTNEQLYRYKAGFDNPYLEELVFQYGRYLLIATSRPGTLPANLQGVWTQYETSPWSGGYWHNVNIQMNYWPAFTTNLAETFVAYRDYNEAFRHQAESLATEYIRTNNPSAVESENGWTVGTGATAFHVSAPGGHSGPGTGTFTSKMLWDEFEFTRDTALLLNHAYPAVLGMSKFLAKTLKPYDDLLLVQPSYSPEQPVNPSVWNVYYETIGSIFDQTMVLESHRDVLNGASILGKQDAFLEVCEEQMGKLDAVKVGYSGQIKEYREEKYYGEIGEKNHRHISQLCALFPGTTINANTPAWLDAAKVTLHNRGDYSTGWGVAFRQLCWARTKEGDRSYKIYQNLLRSSLTPNLWDLCPPFQIDGNLGATAGVAEMLLQSHEGYIEPLPALPEAWKDGRFERLLARGNFEVSATWTNGSATEIRITSKSGEQCVLKYDKSSLATLENDKGENIDFVTVSRDKISFPTKKGETYYLTAIPEKTNVASPESLNVNVVGTEAVLTWTPSVHAQKYRIYVAVEDASDYTLAGETDRTDYKWNIPPMKPGRITFKVTAVDNEGNESKGVLQYYILNTEITTDVPAIADNVLFFPNPTDGLLYVTGLDKCSKAEVYDAVGKKVLEQYVSDCLDMKSLETGVYFVAVNGSAPAKIYKK